MSKTFRPWDIEQRSLLPRSVHELVPVGTVAHFVRQQLDLSGIFAAYDEERGYPPYHMMVAVPLYSYSRGVYSSRRIAQACEMRVDFIAVTAMNQPDFSSSADARALPGPLADVRAVLHPNPKEVSTDAGYCDERNLRQLARRRIDGCLAPGRARHGQKHAAGLRRWPKGSRKAAMAMKLKRAGRRSHSQRIVEPVFGLPSIPAAGPVHNAPKPASHRHFRVRTPSTSGFKCPAAHVCSFHAEEITNDSGRQCA
jgi:hypothetical protein